MRHIFVNVVRASHDPFAGVRQMLADHDEDDQIVVNFTDTEFDIVAEIEYSGQRWRRIIRYPRLFKILAKNISQAIGNDRHPAIVYFSDEGVWAAFWADFRRHRAFDHIVAVNVQHGQAPLERARWRRARRVINAVSRLFTGYPVLGYGSLAGIGAGSFDLYLTYDQVAADFITLQSGCRAIVAPHVIKHDLISALVKLTPNADAQRRVLFAMNVAVPGSPIKCDVLATLDQLYPLAEGLDRLGLHFVIRLHPGMDIAMERRRALDHPIMALAELDDDRPLQQSIADAAIVTSFVSTVLWEASLVGKTAVQVVCPCCEFVELGYDRDVIDLRDPAFDGKLAAIVARIGQPALSDWRALESAEWATVANELLRS